VCFSYDERESLEASAAQLGDALRSLGAHQRNRDFTVLAHSMGGLVARRALVELEPGASQRFRLVAISTPFSGILASRDCGNLALHVLSLGVTAAVCQLVTGSKWSEIPPGSTFTRHPGVLPDNVLEHLQIVTDEAGSCRTRAANGACAQDDFVFSIGEQTNPLVDSDRRVTRVVARVGHSEVIGLEGRPPTLLVGLLREHAVLTAPAANPTTARR
jgi:hypothetical protein